MNLFDVMKHSGVAIPTTEAQRNELVVTEASNGYWHYHLSRRNNLLRALCSVPTLPTAIPVSAWGSPGEENLPKRPVYCQACARLAWPQAETAAEATSTNPGRTE